MMLTAIAPVHAQDQERAATFLARDLLVNFHLISTLTHEGASIAGIAESGEAVVGVAIATRGAIGRPSLLRLDAIGPIALRRLLGTLRERPTRLMLHRDWQHAVIERELGPFRLENQITMSMYAADRANAVDTRVRVLTGADIAAARARSASWILDRLDEHLARGWQVLGIESGGTLLSYACRGYPTEAAEEICNLFTAPEHRGQGMATAVVAAAAGAILARGKRPVYFSNDTNYQSRRVAARAGFQPVVTLREVSLL